MTQQGVHLMLEYQKSMAALSGHCVGFLLA